MYLLKKTFFFGTFLIGKEYFDKFYRNIVVVVDRFVAVGVTVHVVVFIVVVLRIKVLSKKMVLLCFLHRQQGFNV